MPALYRHSFPDPNVTYHSDMGVIVPVLHIESGRVICPRLHRLGVHSWLCWTAGETPHGPTVAILCLTHSG